MMPHHLTVASPEGKPLGTREEVVGWLSSALPGISWTEEPSWSDELSPAGRSVLEPFLSKEVQAGLSMPRLTGTYVGGDFTFRLSCFESHPLTWFYVLIEGGGDPLPTLHRVCWAHRWGLQDDTGEWLTPDTAWEAFCRRAAGKKRVVFGPPEGLRIPRDEVRFEYVGRYGGGRQFMAFVTGAFPRGDPSPDDWARRERWYAVLHHFDADGNHLGTDAWSGGTTAEGKDEAVERASRKLEGMLTSLGEHELCDIVVKPFQFEQDGYRFALVYEDPDTFPEYVVLWPNNIMFHPPWDSGEYST
jgi:formate hydrogenlyase regulatory protein HycA